MLENGISSARQIAENLNIPRPSIYDNLKILITYGLVTEQERESKKLFQVDDVKNVSRLVKAKIDNLQQQEKSLKEILPAMNKKVDYLEPKVKFYNGAEGIRHALDDMMWYENIDSVCFWPINEMIDILGEDYLKENNKKRIKRNIRLRSIWPQDKAVKF